VIQGREPIFCIECGPEAGKIIENAIGVFEWSASKYERRSADPSTCLKCGLQTRKMMGNAIGVSGWSADLRTAVISGCLECGSG